MTFKYGIEHELAFLRPDGDFADFTNTSFEELAAIIELLPEYPDDYDELRIGDAGIRHKRWYIEGMERFDEAGNMLYCVPKGIEIRTRIHTQIPDVIEELSNSLKMLVEIAGKQGFAPAHISYNPFEPEFPICPPFNDYEDKLNAGESDQKLAMPMMTFGPDLNLSTGEFSDQKLIDIAEKLTYYSPFIVPFSFSSPFQQGQLQGHSQRTFHRTGLRPAVVVYPKSQAYYRNGYPALTRKAKLPVEVGRIEFKAFDSCADFELYAALLVLLKGLILDNTLPGRCSKPDAVLHQLSAEEGFGNSVMLEKAKQVCKAASDALGGDADSVYMAVLENMLVAKETPASEMRKKAERGASIFQIVREPYSKGLIQGSKIYR